jgi:molybdate transport system permease protein
VRYRASRSPFTWLGWLLALYLAVPLAAFLIRLAGAAPGERGFRVPGLWPALWTSVESATISTALAALFGIPLARWMASSRGWPARAAGMLVLLPIALPPVMSGLVLIYLVGPYTFLGQLFNGSLTESVAGVVLAQTFVAGPFLVIAARSAFETVDPALEDLAASLGHRPAARFWLVTMRIAAPGIRAGLLLTWLRAIGEYGATVLLAYHPFTLPVYTFDQFSSTGIPTTQAPTALALGVAIVVLILAEIRLPRLLPGPRRCARTAPPAAGAMALAAGTGHAPGPVEPVRVGMRLDARAGAFRLEVAHQAAGHRIAVLGPSGAGKSMTLRALAGFLGPEAGEVRFNADDVTRVPAEARRVGFVPQGHPLFPGRTVWEQVMFAVDADPGLAAWWLRTLRLDGLEGRLPGQLSGGQQQRVALARALARRPRLLLLDEPFNALDAPVREELRGELRRLQRDAGLSTVLVTHDPEEAALLADEIWVIADGRLLQAGPRAEVFARPASPRVARLLGIPNLVPAVVDAPGLLAVGDLRLAADTAGLPPGASVLWTIRPDHVTVLPGQPGETADAEPETYPAEVDDVADIGTLTTLTIRLRTGQAGGPALRVRTTAPETPTMGDACRVRLPATDITAWPTAPVKPVTTARVPLGARDWRLAQPANTSAADAALSALPNQRSSWALSVQDVTRSRWSALGSSPRTSMTFRMASALPWATPWATPWAMPWAMPWATPWAMPWATPWAMPLARPRSVASRSRPSRKSFLISGNSIISSKIFCATSDALYRIITVRVLRSAMLCPVRWMALRTSRARARSSRSMMPRQDANSVSQGESSPQSGALSGPMTIGARSKPGCPVWMTRPKSSALLWSKQTTSSRAGHRVFRRTPVT